MTEQILVPRIPHSSDQSTRLDYKRINNAEKREIIEINLTGVKGAIFDLDGTIVNSMDYHNRSFVEFLGKNEVSLTKEAYADLRLSGKSNRQVVEYFFRGNLTQDRIWKYVKQKDKIFSDLVLSGELKEINGARDTLKKLKKHDLKLAIASGSTREIIELLLNKLKIRDLFANNIIGGENGRPGKPNPEPFLNAAMLLGLPSKKCIAFEDAPSGVQSALAAGMPVIGIQSTRTENLTRATVTVPDFTKLTFIKK